MTSTNDGKDVINIRSSGQKGKAYYIELFKSIDGGLSSDCELRVRTRHLCDAWRSIHSICQQSALSTLPHLLNWIQRHTARTVLQTEWNKTESKDENHKLLEDAINGFLEECRVAVSSRNGVSPPWESQLVQRGKWFQQILANPWGHPVLRVLLDSEAQPPSDKEVLEWLKEERSLMFSTRLRQLAADKRCVDLALLLVSAVMDRRRATITLIPDAEQVDAKDKPVPQCSKPTFVDELKEAGFVQDMWELLTDMEFVLLHKRDKRARCIELAKQTPLRDGYPLVERLRSRLETSPREKKLWKNAADVATLIAQVIITRCMVVGRCAGLVRSVLFCCTSSLVRLLPAARLPAAAAALAAPAATARHLHTLAAAVNKQLQCTSDMKPFVCELYVRAITAAMNELERLKLKAEKEAEARGMEQMLAAWVTQLGALLAASQRLRCECALTAFSVHPSAPMYEAIRAAPPLQHKVVHESKEEQTTSEFGSWASDSRSQTNFVKTSETLNLKQTQHRANVLSTAILNEGEALGLSPELCQDITVLLSGLRLKTLSWDMDRELLLENCRTYMERTGAGTRAVTTELKYLNLDPRHFEHLPFEDEDENDIYYGIEKGYEHLVDQYQEPEDIWPILDDPEQTESCYSTDIESKVIPRVRKKKTKKIPVIYDQEVDPLSFATDTKIKEKKKERPHSKERSKDRSTGKIKMEIPRDPLELDSNSEITNDTKEIRNEEGKEKKKRGRKKKDITVKSESKPSSLSNLIGIKVTRPIDFHLTCKPNVKNEKTNKIPVSDSDYDRQGKSSLNSLNSEENDPNVLFDGLFSMDELKSPDRNTDKLGITKNNEAYLNNTSIVINTPVPKSVSKNVETVTNTISQNSNCDPNPLPLEAKSKVTEDVKNSLAKLLQYRRDKTMNKLYEQNSSYAHPFTNSTKTINRDVGKLSTTIAKPQLPSQSSQQPLNVSNTPKVHINKRQSEQLSGLKNQIDNLMKSQISSKPVTSQYVQNVNRNIGIRLSKPVHSSRLEDNYDVQNELLQKSVSTSNEMKTQKSQNRDTVSQSNFQDFLYQLQKSINAGAATDLPNVQNRMAKKEIQPVSRVTPIIPVTSTIELKQHPQSSKPLAQQVKLKTVPNTFSRLSYIHKNSMMNDQRMNQIQACIEQQDQALKNPGIPLITDHNLTEFKRSKLKYLQGKDLVISRVDKSLQKPNESSQLNKKNRNPKIETAVSADHPLMSSILMQNNLISTHKTYAKDVNQTKQTQIDRHRDYTKITSNKSKSELSEKDQNDLLLLLRQQRKQNATQPKFGNIGTSTIQPSQGPTINSIIHSNKYDTVKYNQSTGNIMNTPSSIQEAKVTNYQNSSIKPIHTIQSSLYMGSKQKSDIDKTELICTKNVNLQPTKNQKTEVCNKIDGKRDIKEWESVLNEILSYKTPKRVPSILEIPVNKNISVYRQNQAKDILTTPLVSKSIGDPIQIIPKVKEQIKTPASKSVSNKVPIHNSRKDPQILRKSLSKSSLKDTKNKTMAQTHETKSKHDIIKTSSGMRNTNSVSMKPVQSEVPKGQFQADENKRLSQSDVSKRYNNVHKKQFTHSLPKEDDPFISGIRNSDYDLLEELMDDDLRQEIGELSDEDCYSASMSAQKDSKSFIVVNRGTISQEEKSLVGVPVCANHHQTTIKPQNIMKCYKPVISTPDTSLIKRPSTNFDNSPTKFDNTESKMMEHMSSNNKVCQLSRNIASTPTYDNNINNIKSQATTDQSNVFLEPVAQQTTLQNLVLIGSEIVYTQPCTVTQIPIANITPNSYVALNNQSNMELYQSTQFSAPVIKPLIVGNATVLSTVPVENRHSRPISKNSEVNKFSNHDKIAEHVFPAPESKFDLNLFTSGDNVNGKCHSVLESKKGMSEFNCNKNGERKVLSEVQAKLAISKKPDLKIIRNQTALVDNDIKKEMSIDQERLKNKRMAILNRNIFHRCDHKPIALTYAPIEPVSGKEQEKQVDDNRVSCNNNSNLKIELFNRQVGKKPSLSQRLNLSSKSVNSQENFKENKTDSVTCRRILLRSSNKLSKIESSNVTSSETLSVKTKARLKSNADDIKIKLKGKCNNTVNHISDKRTKIKEKTLKKQISSKLKHKLKNKKTETFDQYSLGNINYYKQETIDSKSSLTEKVDVEEQLIALKIPKQILSEPSTKTNIQTENQTLLANQNKCKLIHDSFKNNVSLQQESLEGTIAQALSEKVDVEEQLIALKIPKQILIPEPSTTLSTKNDQSENQTSLINQNKCERVEDCCKDNESLQHQFLGDKNVKPLSEKIDVEEQLIAQKISKQGLLINPSTEMCLMANQVENQTLKFNQNVYEKLYDISKDNESLQQDLLEVKNIPALSEKVDTEDQTIALKNPKKPLIIGFSTKNEIPINDQTLTNDQNKLEHVYDNSEDNKSLQESFEAKNVPVLSDKVDVEDKLFALKISKQISLFEHSKKMSSMNNQTENQTLPANQNIHNHIYDNFRDNESPQYVTVEDDIPVLSAKVDEIKEKLIASKLSKQVLLSKHSTIMSQETNQTENPTLPASHKFEHIHDSFKYNELIEQDCLEVGNEPVISEKVDVEEQLVALKIPKQVLLSDPSTKLSQINNQTENQTSPADQDTCEYGNNESLQQDSLEIENITHDVQDVFNDKKGKGEDKMSITEYDKVLNLHRDILKNDDVIKKLKQHPKNKHSILPATQPSNQSLELVKSKSCKLDRGKMRSKSNKVFKDNAKNISNVVASTDKPKNKKNNEKRKLNANNSNTQSLNIINDSKSAKEINGVISVPQSYKDSIIIEEIPIKDNDSFKKCVLIKLPSGRIFRGTVYSEINVNVDTLFSDPTIRNLLLSNLTDKKRYTLNVKHPTIKNKVVKNSIKENQVSNKNDCDCIETINLLSDEEDDDSNQFLNTDYGKYKVNKTDLLKHQKRFNDKCFVKLNRIDLPQSINNVESIYKPNDDITNVNSDTVCPDIITQNKETMNKLSILTSTLLNSDSTENRITNTSIKENLGIHKSKDPNFIEIDDLSNDSPKLNSFDSSKLSMDKDKMNDLKDLLLLDLDITEQIKDNATEKLTSEVNNIINGFACQMVDSKCDQNTPIEINTVLNSVVAIDSEEGSSLFTQSRNSNCYVKLTNCDELAMKHEQIKWMKQNCFVKLVRCDHQVNLIEGSTKREADMAEEETDDIIDKVIIREMSDTLADTLSRSGSFSILNEYSVLDDTPVPVEFERSTSPVIDVYEAIITLNNVIDTKLSLFTENSVCKSEWCMTKTELRLQNQLIMNEVHSDNNLRENLTNNFSNVQLMTVICSQSACVFNAPKLTSILTKFFQDNYHIIDRFNNTDSVFTRTNMRLKRKSTTLGGTTIKRKMNKKCFSNITVQEYEECRIGANIINRPHFRDQVHFNGCNNHGMENLDMVETDKFLNTEEPTSCFMKKRSDVLKIADNFMHKHDTAQYSELHVEQHGIETKQCTPNIYCFRKKLLDNKEVPQKINCINDLTIKNNLQYNINDKIDSLVKQDEHSILCLKDDITNNLPQNVSTHHMCEGIGQEISDENVMNNKHHKFQIDGYNEIDIDVHDNKRNLICSENTISYQISEKFVHEINSENIVNNKYKVLQNTNVHNEMDVEVDSAEQNQDNIKNFANNTKNNLVLNISLNKNSLKFTQDVNCVKNNINEFQRDLHNKMSIVEERDTQNKLNMSCIKDFNENDYRSTISRQKSIQKIKKQNDKSNKNYELKRNAANEIDTRIDRDEQDKFDIISLKDDSNNLMHNTSLIQNFAEITHEISNSNECVNNVLHTDVHNQINVVMEQNQLNRSLENDYDSDHSKSLCMLRDTISSTSKQNSEKVTHTLNINSFHIDNSKEKHYKRLIFPTENNVRPFNIVTSIANDNYSELISCSPAAEENDKTANSCNHIRIVDTSVNTQIDSLVSIKSELVSSDNAVKIVQEKVENKNLDENVVDHKQIDIDKNYNTQRDTVNFKYDVKSEKVAKKVEESINKNMGTDLAPKMNTQQYEISSDRATECVDVNTDLSINHNEIIIDDIYGLERDKNSQQNKVTFDGNLNNATKDQEIAFDVNRHVHYLINGIAANDVRIKTDKDDINHKEIITVDDYTIKNPRICETIRNNVSNHQEVAYDDKHAQYVISGSALDDVQNKTSKNEIDCNKIITVDNCIRENDSDIQNEVVCENFNHKKSADHIHLHGNREYYEVVHESVANMQIKFDEKLVVHKNDYVDFQNFEVAYENVAENVEVGDENLIIENEVTVDCVYEVVTADITKETNDAIETPNVSEHDYTTIPKSLKHFRRTDAVYSDLGEVTSLRTVDTQDVLTNFETIKSKPLYESGCSRLKMINKKGFLLKKGNITSPEEKEQTSGNGGADTQTQEIWECDSYKEKNKDTSSAESDSEIILKGLEFEDPEMGICYVFPLVTTISESSDSDANNINDEILDLSCDEKINYDFKLNIPNRTYSKECISTGIKFRALCYDKKSEKCLKRKMGMTDIQTFGKKYRKGKGIDHPKITIADMSEMGYTKQFKHLFDYFSSVKFSYSLNFHKESINVHNMLCNWPIQSFCNNAVQMGSEIEENLFIDIETNGKPTFFDPKEQTLAEEIRAEYDETNYSFNNINETNFDMGFGEGSDRVIKYLKGRDDSLKNSAAALSDVKQSQPLLVSEISIPSLSTVQDQIQKLQRHYGHIQLRYRGRFFFRKTKAELTHDCLKENKYYSSYDISNFPFGLNSTACTEPRFFESVVQPLTKTHGEESDRIIQNLKGRDDSSKNSAEFLLDVKQSQPILVSESTTLNISTVKDQIEKLQRHYAHVQLRDRVRSFFRKTKAELTHDWLKDNKKDYSVYDISNFPFGLNSSEFIEPRFFETVVQVVQVGQLPVSATAQNPVTCDPRVTQVSNISPAQCTAESSPNDDPQVAIKTEYTELTTADLSLPIVPEYALQKQTVQMESQEAPNLHMSDEKNPVETELKSIIKIEMVEETPEIKTEIDENEEINESQIASDKDNISNADYSFSNIDTNANIAQDNTNPIFDSSEKQIISGGFPQQMLQKEVNGSLEKTDQIAHAMSAAGITTTDENITNTRAHALVNILAQKILQNNMTSTPSSTNTYPKTTSINAMALQQALSQILPPPLNQTNVNDNNQQAPNSTVTPQVLHIVQSKNSSGNQITLVDNTQQSVINTPNATPVLHIVQNKGNAGPTSDGTSTPQTNAFSGLSLGDAGIQQGGNQLLHIVNTGNQKTTNAGQLLKRVNLLTNLTNVQGSNEQKMVQFVCKSADGKAIQLNASHQRGMVLRLQPIESPNTQNTQAKHVDAHDISPTNNTNTDPSKEIIMSQQEIKSRSIYEENYAKFIQNSSNKTTVLEKSTSLPKFNQAFGKQVFQDSNQNQHDNNSNSHVPSINSNNDSTECQSTDNAINLEHISQISSPPLLLRKSPAQTSQAQTNLVQQIKQTMAPMNVQTMHGGVIYTRQIPVNIGGGQTINLITVPSTELIDDPTQKQQTDVKFVNQGEMEPSIIKIVPQTANSDVSIDENNTHAGASNENPHTPQSQPPPVLTQMRIKLPMLSKAPQMVSGARVVRPSFFQIQRNVIGGGNQPVYQQLVLTAAPPLGQQTIRLPQAPASRQMKVPSESHSSSESQMSSSTLEQLREFDLVLEQVKERSTVQPNTKSNGPYSKLHTVSNDTTDGTISASTISAETTQQVLYSVANTQPVNVAYVNRKATISTSVCSPDSSGAADSSTTSTHTQHRRHTITSDLAASETPPQSKPTKVSSKSRSRPKASSNPLNTLKLNSVPPKTSTQKPVEDEQTTQRILYILAEYREQVENSPDKDKPAPRRRSNPPLNPSGSSKRKKSSSSSRRPGGRDISPVHGEDTCRTMGSEDSSCGTSQGDCNESCLDSHSPQNSPRKIVRKLTFENEMPITQPRPQPQRNVIVADGQTITVARGTAGKPATAVLMPANYILPVSLVKGGQQIAIVTNRGPKLLTVGGGEGGATNALLLQRLIGPAGLKPILTRPGVRHIRLPTAALHNLQAFNLATNTTVQPSDSTTSSTVSAPTPPELVKTRADSSAWTDRDCQDVKPERASSPECSEPWNLPSSADPHDYIYEETVRADNMNRTVLVVHRKDGSSHRQHRLTHVSAAALRHKYAILEHELRLQKSLSEECEDLGVDSPSASELFPEAELLFAASPAHDHTPDQAHHSHTPQPTVLSQSGMPQPDIDDQIATDQLLTRNDLQDDRSDLNLGLEDVGIVTVSEDGMQATIALDQEEFARSHPNTTFHSEPTDDGEVQPYTISDLKARHITSTIFHSNRTPGTVLMTAPQTTVISQATAVSSGVQNTQNVKYSDIDNMINSLPGAHANTINLSSVLVKDDGLTRYDHILNDSRELHLSNTASAIVHSTGNATQVIKRLYYDDDKRDTRYMVDEPEDLIAREDAKMIVEDSSRDATLESMADVEDYRSSPDRNTELFWESNSASERSESRRPLDFSSDSDKCCKSPSFDETNSTDSSGVGAHIRLDSVIKDARGIERSGSADGSSADDTHPPLRTYPAKRLYHHPLDGDIRHSMSGKTRAGERSPFPTGAPDTLEGRRRASARGVVKRCCHCCNGSPAPPRPKKIRPKKPTMDFINHH